MIKTISFGLRGGALTGRSIFAVFMAAAFLVSGFFAPQQALAVVSSINLTGPVGGEHLNDGIHITWTAVGVPGDLVDILWSTNDFTDSTNLTVSGVAYNLGSYDWNTVAAGITTDVSTYKIRIQEHGGAVQSSSPSNFRIDNVVPTITSVTTYDTDLNGTVDKATIVFSEPVRDSSFSASNFTIDGQVGSSIVTGTADDNTFDVLFTTVTGTGVKSITYTAGGGTDMATPGNALATVTKVATDSAKPVFLSAKTKTTTTIEATFSEDLDGATVNGTGTEFTVAGYAVSAAAETAPGVITLTVATMPTNATPDVTFTNIDNFKDLAGNQAVTPITRTATDGTAPVLSSVHIASNNANPVFAKVSDVITVTFTSSEAVNTPVVTISGNAALVSNTGGNNWQATYTMQSGDTTGLVSFLIAFSDVNGNAGVSVSAVTDASSVTFDKTNPSVSITTPVVDSVTTVNNVDAVFVVSDTNAVTCAYTVTIDHVAPAAINCAGANIGTLTDGRRVLELTATDAAGNTASDDVSFVINLDANLTVNWAGGADFTMIQPAVTRATSGDEIDIAGPHDYGEVVDINGKNLTLVGSGGPTTTSFTLTSTTVSGSSGITAPTVNVNSGAKIQDGHLLVSTGGTINVGPGTYNEYLVINKNGLTIQSTSGAGLTIVDVQGHANEGVGIRADNVTFSGFTVQNPTTNPNYEMRMIHVEGSNNTVRNNIVVGNLSIWNDNGVQYGIYVRGPVGGPVATGNIIENNEVENINYIGIEVYGASGNVTSGNTISSNDVHDVGFYAIAIDRSPGNTITQNTISNLLGMPGYPADSSTWGIIIWGELADGNTITDQTVTGLANGGIVLSSAHNTSITNSIISSNTNIGIKISVSGWAGGVPLGNSISNSVINVNGDVGVFIGAGVDATAVYIDVNNNKISDNGNYGVNNLGTGTLTAEQVWWGEVSGPYHSPENTLGLGNAVSDNVDYSPWCTEEIGCLPFGSSDPIDHFDIDPSAPSSIVNVPITLTVTAKDAADITRVNDVSVVSMAADHGASLGTLLLTLVSGVKDTTVVNSVTGTVNVSGIKVGGSATGSTSVSFTNSDIAAPTIVGHTPADDITDVAITVMPYIVFSEPLKASTVNSTNIKLKKYSDDSTVSAVVSLVEGGTQVNIDPDSSLENNAQYYFAVSTGVKDEVGNPLSVALDASTKISHEFTTVAIQPVVVDEIIVQSNTATPTDSYLAGWHYTFRITVNTAETNLRVKFTDWVNSANPLQTVAANGNMRLLFNTSTGNGLGSIVGLTDADIVAGVGPIHSFTLGNLYTDQAPGAISLSGLDISTDPGRQIKFDVFTKLPVTTAPGFYETVFVIETL